VDFVYTDIWEREYTSGSNFGARNDVPEPELMSPIVLNEVLFYPNAVNDHFVELYNRGAAAVDISGYKIVCDTEYIIPDGTVLDFYEHFFYLLYDMNNGFFDNMDSSGDNIYLYDEKGSLLDMVGWNSQHTIDQTICRIPKGNGTRNGYEDVSSIAAGWRFNCTPTVRLIKVDINRMVHKEPTEYGHFKSYVLFNLTISNLQQIGDIINILNSSQEGWAVGIFDETGTIKIENISVIADSTMFILVNVTLPDSIPFAVMDNITISIQSSNSVIIRDSIVLNVRVYPFLNLTKNASPNQIYINGTGHDEITTITLNMTGMGEKEERPYLDCVFCIDSSGSMAQNDPDDLRKVESQNFVAEHFEVPDRAAVVDFDETAFLQPYGWPTGDHLSSNYTKIIANIELIDSFGGTSVSPGLNMSNEELRLYGQPADHIPIIILITDAETSGVAACIQEANIAASRGVIIFTIGLAISPGSTSEQLLIDIANITGGRYFEAPNASFFKNIYENISGFLTDLAVWDNDTTDPHPLARDVLPWYIDYVPGTFSIQPDNIFNDSVTGETIIEWNIPWVKLNVTWSVSFDVKSNLLGMLETNVYDKSRAFYTRWDDTTDTVLFPRCWVYVLPPAPMPPELYIDTLPNKNDIYLYWEESIFPGTDHYLIYRAPTPTGFDFSTPWVDTQDILANGVDPIDLSIIPNRLSWNHTGAADPSDGNYSEQWYYCIRAVNAIGEMSYTSRTVGKWTRNFAAGTGTFSFPLQPLFDETAEYYTQDMNARFIKWMDPGTRYWVQHDQGEVGDDTTMEVGKGYEVDFAAATRYTFLGMPGAMIRYKTDSPFGFDYATEAASLTASADPMTGDVTLTWMQPASRLPSYQYHVYYTTTRDGFFGTKGIDYLLLAIKAHGDEMAVHAGAATAGTQFYYMVIPVNTTNAEGASTYSIGVWTSNIRAEYDTIAIPLQLISVDHSADWYCDNIPYTVGINYFIYTDARWGWHATRMPAGAFDPTIVMTEGYQISTSDSTKFTFIGV
jgi:Mg-chelatase subunit ChlD